MSLDEFITNHFREILSRAIRQLHASHPDRPEIELGQELPEFLREIVRALRAGDACYVPPTEEASAAALRHAHQLQRLGYPIRDSSCGFGAVCNAIAGIAVEHHVDFTAREFQILNQCADAAVATAVTEYWHESEIVHERQAAERLGFLAHELRNALSSATMGFAVIKSGHASTPGQTTAIVDRSLARMGDLIGQSLADVQMKSGMRADTRPLRLRPLLQEIAGAAVPERNITLRIEASEALDVCADARLLTAALTNLVQNGLKFTSPGGHVVLRAHERGTTVVIEVEDECGGLSEGQGEDLFRPFVQEGANRSGVGLGLAITREAIDAQGGAIHVRNLPGRGCVFSVELPRAASSGRRAAPPELSRV
jgi:signal transduction histidine kinase